jgi:hypothetical protein
VRATKSSRLPGYRVGDDGVHEPEPGGETTEQWCDRANARYLRRWEVFGVEGVAWRGPGCSVRGEYPVVDDGYNGAMDALEDADHERGEAAIALDRQLYSVVPGGQIRRG